MKLIEALKNVKYLEKKADDLKTKISRYCTDMDYETPVYPDQKQQVDSWMQAYRDVLKEISNLHYRIQKTNISVRVKIELDGKEVEKSIAEWILRRRKTINMEYNMYSSLTDKGLREGHITTSSGQSVMAKVRRYYDPKERDHRMSSLSKEPFEIDSKLEIVNAVTDLVD